MIGRFEHAEIIDYEQNDFDEYILLTERYTGRAEWGESGREAFGREMAEQIGRSGRVALYGIHFDTDSACIRSDSESTLSEIARLLRDRSELKLLVVGHTDNQGGFDYNIDLSRRRAEAVSGLLVSGYGIDARRLKSWGVGFTAPKAPNDSDTNRALNRRVELVEW